jgi:tetratricopeptide (TPR) repeat protein
MRSQLFRSIVFSLFTIIICSSFGIGQIPNGATAGFSRQITGIVRYAGSNIPAENVLVRVERFAGGLEGQAMTDKTGKFSFANLRAETYVVTIHAPGYMEVRQEVELLTQSSEYINASLIRDKNSMINPAQAGISTLNLPVVDNNVPANAQSQFAAAKTILDSGKKDKIPEAVQHLQKAISIYPKYLEAQLMLGYALMDMHEWDKAETALREAIVINSNASTAYFALGEVYRRQKKYSAAEEVLLQGIKANEQAAAGHFALANVYYEKAPSTGDEAQFRQALQDSWKEVNRALELDPKHARAHLLAGDLLLRARHPKEALVHFEEYLKLEPNGEFATQTKTIVEKIKKALSESKSS